MVKITFELDDNLNEKLRKSIASSKGLYRGAIQEALIEAIHLWITSSKRKKGKNQKKITNKSENITNNDENLNPQNLHFIVLYYVFKLNTDGLNFFGR